MDIAVQRCSDEVKQRHVLYYLFLLSLQPLQDIKYHTLL